MTFIATPDRANVDAMLVLPLGSFRPTGVPFSCIDPLTHNRRSARAFYTFISYTPVHGTFHGYGVWLNEEGVEYTGVTPEPRVEKVYSGRSVAECVNALWGMAEIECNNGYEGGGTDSATMIDLDKVTADFLYCFGATPEELAERRVGAIAALKIQREQAAQMQASAAAGVSLAGMILGDD